MEYVFSDKVTPLKPSAIREIFKSLTDPSVISFAAGNPSPESFPVEAIRKFSAEILENNAAFALQYGITEGYAPLREAVLDRCDKKFNAVKAGDTALITSGGQQGIELAAKILLNEGDTVICENPSFIGALNAFRSYGAKTVGVPMEEDGIDIAQLEETVKKARSPKILYLIPTFQNPTGKTMSLEKRKECLKIAEKYGLVILEDNPYGEIRFSGEDIPTIKSMDETGCVIYCGSFSKVLSAGLRVGFVICNDELATKMAVCKQVSDVHTNLFSQMLCHKLLTEFDIDTHIDGIKALYRRKSALMISCLEKELPSEIEFTRPEGGLFIWATLPRGYDVTPFIRMLTAKKLAVVPGATFNCDVTEPSSGFRMNYSTPSDEQIEAGVKILAAESKEFLAQRSVLRGLKGMIS